MLDLTRIAPKTYLSRSTGKRSRRYPRGIYQINFLTSSGSPESDDVSLAKLRRFVTSSSMPNRVEGSGCPRLIPNSRASFIEVFGLKNTLTGVVSPQFFTLYGPKIRRLFQKHYQQMWTTIDPGFVASQGERLGLRMDASYDPRIREAAMKMTCERIRHMASTDHAMAVLLNKKELPFFRVDVHLPDASGNPSVLSVTQPSVRPQVAVMS